MKKHQIFYLALLILPWLTVPYLGVRAFKRFFPASLFMSLFITVESIIAHKKVWWWFYKKLHPKLPGEIPLTFGPFLVASLWILKLTFGKFKNYFNTNFILAFLFAYPGLSILKRFGLVSLVRMKKYQMLLLFTFKAMLMYGFQWMVEKRKNY